MTEHAIWTREETEQLVQWLEEPENLRKIKKGSGVSKKQIINEISARIPTKPTIKVGYKYDNLLKSYREAVKLNGQSGWGLTATDLSEGKKGLREKLLSRCAYFFRLEAILGDRPNVHPPFQFDSEQSQGETAQAVERLIEAMGGKEDAEERGWKEEELDIEGEGSGEGKWREAERERRIRRDFIREGEDVERQEEPEENEFEKTSAAQNQTQVPVPLSPELVVSDNEYYYEEEEGQERRSGDMEILESGAAGEIKKGGGQRAERGQEEQGRDIHTRSPEPQGRHLTYASAIRAGKRRRFPQLVENEEEEEVGRGTGRGSKKRKGGSETLIDAVCILASAKTEGEEKKFDFLNHHLLQQGDLRREELELERERLAMEREKAQSEQKKLEFMMLQLQASIQSKQNQHCSTSESSFSYIPDSS